MGAGSSGGGWGRQAGRQQCPLELSPVPWNQQELPCFTVLFFQFEKACTNAAETNLKKEGKGRVFANVGTQKEREAVERR